MRLRAGGQGGGLGANAPNIYDEGVKPPAIFLGLMLKIMIRFAN